MFKKINRGYYVLNISYIFTYLTLFNLLNQLPDGI
jgi:hypothetical protein